MTKITWAHLTLYLCTHILSGYFVCSLAGGAGNSDSVASRHWNYWKDRLGVPYISNATKTKVLATLSHTTYLHCVVGNLGDRQVSWIRTRDLRVLAIGKIRYTQDTRFTPLHEEGNDVWALKIQETRMSDSGLYECQVSYHDDVEKKLKVPVRLIVLDSYAIIKGSTERHVKEGSGLSLFCTIEDSSGTPSFVFWYRDDEVVNYSDRTGIRIMTNGHQNDIGGQQPRPQQSPVASKNDSFVNSSTTATAGTTTSPEDVSSLHIDNVRPRDAGIYTCAPSNAKNHSVVVHVIKGENLAMQRENEKGGGGVQPQHQASANSSEMLKPLLKIHHFLSFFFLLAFSNFQNWTVNKHFLGR